MVNNIIGGEIGRYPDATNAIHKYNALTTEWTLIGNWVGSAVYSESDNNIYVLGEKIMIFSVEKETIINEFDLFMQVEQSAMMIYNQSLINFGGLYNRNPMQSTT
eukprot:548736_1